MNFIVGGSDVPHERLMADHAALLDYMSNNIGISNFAFGELVQIDSWRYIKLLSFLASGTHTCLDRIFEKPASCR